MKRRGGEHLRRLECNEHGIHGRAVELVEVKSRDAVIGVDVGVEPLQIC